MKNKRPDSIDLSNKLTHIFNQDSLPTATACSLASCIELMLQSDNEIKVNCLKSRISKKPFIYLNEKLNEHQ